MRRVTVALLVICVLLGPVVSRADEPDGRAAVVVRFGHGQSVVRVVTFEDQNISGMDLLQASGLPLVTQDDALVCRIGPDGCDHPEEKCVCGRDFWSYWHLGADGWTFSGQGAASYAVPDGGVDGWVWGRSDTPEPVERAALLDTTRAAPGLATAEVRGPLLRVGLAVQGDTNNNAKARVSIADTGALASATIELQRAEDRFVGLLPSGCPLAPRVLHFAVDDPDGVRGSARWELRIDVSPARCLPLIRKQGPA